MAADNTTLPRRPGTIGTSDRYRDAAGQVWKLTKKGWRQIKPKGKK